MNCYVCNRPNAATIIPEPGSLGLVLCRRCAAVVHAATTGRDVTDAARDAFDYLFLTIGRKTPSRLYRTDAPGKTALGRLATAAWVVLEPYALALGDGEELRAHEVATVLRDAWPDLIPSE